MEKGKIDDQRPGGGGDQNMAQRNMSQRHEGTRGTGGDFSLPRCQPAISGAAFSGEVCRIFY